MKDKFWMWLAWLLPRELVYFAGVRVFANVSVKHGHLVASEITMFEGLKSWRSKA